MYRLMSSTSFLQVMLFASDQKETWLLEAQPSSLQETTWFEVAWQAVHWIRWRWINQYNESKQIQTLPLVRDWRCPPYRNIICLLHCNSISHCILVQHALESKKYKGWKIFLHISVRVVFKFNFWTIQKYTENLHWLW